FGSYNATYGSLGAVIGFMVWMWFSTIIVLVGGEINAEMEHPTSPWAHGAPKWPTSWARHGPGLNQGCAGALSQEQQPEEHIAWPRVPMAADQTSSPI